jgi:hypothetical protein
LFAYVQSYVERRRGMDKEGGGTGKVIVSPCIGFTKMTDTDTGAIKYFTTAQCTLTMVDSAVNYIFVYYNGGTPQFRVGTATGNRMAWDGTNFTLVSETVTIDEDGILVAPATDVIDETGGYRFAAGTTWGMYGMNGDGPINLYLRAQNQTDDSTANATINISSSVTNSSAVSTINIDAGAAGIVAMTGARFTFTGRTVLSGEITPTALSGNTDNWNPTDLASARCVRVSASGAYNLTGIAAQSEGVELLLMNVGANTITLKHDVTSTAANRFYFAGAADVTLTQYRALLLRYDGTMDRWVGVL